MGFALPGKEPETWMDESRRELIHDSQLSPPPVDSGSWGWRDLFQGLQVGLCQSLLETDCKANWSRRTDAIFSSCLLPNYTGPAPVFLGHFSGGRSFFSLINWRPDLLGLPTPRKHYWHWLLLLEVLCVGLLWAQNISFDGLREGTVRFYLCISLFYFS